MSEFTLNRIDLYGQSNLTDSAFVAGQVISLVGWDDERLSLDVIEPSHKLGDDYPEELLGIPLWAVPTFNNIDVHAAFMRINDEAETYFDKE